jgi:hypothetical protein
VIQIINSILERAKAVWTWVMDQVQAAWHMVCNEAHAMKSWAADLAGRKPTEDEMKFVMRLPSGIIGAVVTGFFFMAASMNTGVAMVVGVILILGSLVIYRWATA